MRNLDWKYPDLLWQVVGTWGNAEHADCLDDLRMDGLCEVARRTGEDGREYVVCVRDGRYWLARLRDPAEYDGTGALVELARSDIRYHDDHTIVEPVGD